MSVKVTLNLPGINRLMKSAGVRALVKREAQRMAAAAGDGFEAVVDNSHPWVSRAYVQTADAEGKRRQADEKVLERVVTS
jgi:hypothetical protein